MKFKFRFLLLFVILNTAVSAQQPKEPIQLGVIGLTHTHVHWLFGSLERGDFTIAGIVEPNRELAKKYANQYNFSMEMVYNTSAELLAAKKFDAVTAFGTIYDHLEVVQTFAPNGIHIMVEKPLAVSLEHAEQMQALAKKHKVHLLTNYETTWYPSNHKAYAMVKEDSLIGSLRKVIVRDGHRGPKKIGVNSEFLEWLTDPKLNGGGSLVDFGCYGVNLLTWLLDGKKPNSVTAITQQLQKENNPKVEDEATIILAYDDLVGIIQASWNWPIGRKDMEIYGLKGAIYADNRNELRTRMAEGYDGFKENKYQLEERTAPFDDPFALFAAVITNKVTLPQNDLSSLENNMIVIEILNAAMQSAKQQKTIVLE